MGKPLKRVSDMKGLEHTLNPKAMCTQFIFKVLSVDSPCVWDTQKGEGLIIVLQGSLDISDKSATYRIGKRQSVFDGRAEGFFIPSKTAVTLVPKTGSVLVALAISNCVPKSKDLQCFPILQKHNIIKKVGKECYLRRVVDIVSPLQRTDYFLAGETYTPKGNWSSYPPHKHDTNTHDTDGTARENSMEEVYFYQSEKFGKLAFQGLYKKSREGFLVSHNDCIHIRNGYHPFSASPECDFYYLWILHGKKRHLQYSVDPKFQL